MCNVLVIVIICTVFIFIKIYIKYFIYFKYNNILEVCDLINIQSIKYIYFNKFLINIFILNIINILFI